jgi:hypothetical protein
MDCIIDILQLSYFSEFNGWTRHAPPKVYTYNPRIQFDST